MALKLIQGKQIDVNLTGSFTGSFTGNLTGTSSYATNASTASLAPNYTLTSSFQDFTSSYYQDSSSFDTRIDSLEQFSSSLDATFATDAELNQATASLSSSISSLSSSFESFTDTYNTGSFTGSFSGSFSGSGADLFDIPASGIVGLNLSQISSGSVSASISPNNGLQVNTNVTATSFTGSLLGTSSYALNGLSSSFASTASFAPNYTLTSTFNNFTGSYNTGSFTGSFIGSLQGTSSWATNSSQAISSSFASTASFAPNYLPLTGGTISGSLTITNNLTVIGSASIQYISESTLNIGTNLITVNTFNPAIRFGGLAVIDSGSSPQVSASFLYDSVQDEFIFVHKGSASGAITSSHFLLGPETYNDLGNEIYLTQNRIPKGTGIEHLNDSNISDNGSVVSINSNTQITGSLSQGQNTIASGSYSHAEGNGAQAIGGYSHAEGGGTQAIGFGSHAEGSNTQAIGGYSHAEGSTTIAIGGHSHAEGGSTQAIGEYSHAEGDTTQAGWRGFSATDDSGTVSISQVGDFTSVFVAPGTAFTNNGLQSYNSSSFGMPNMQSVNGLLGR